MKQVEPRQSRVEPSSFGVVQQSRWQLGIESATWEIRARGINVGDCGLNIQTKRLAKFG
jgi:hypothetical protein